MVRVIFFAFFCVFRSLWQINSTASWPTVGGGAIGGGNLFDFFHSESTYYRTRRLRPLLQDRAASVSSRTPRRGNRGRAASYRHSERGNLRKVFNAGIFFNFATYACTLLQNFSIWLHCWSNILKHCKLIDFSWALNLPHTLKNKYLDIFWQWSSLNIIKKSTAIDKNIGT